MKQPDLIFSSLKEYHAQLAFSLSNYSSCILISDKIVFPIYAPPLVAHLKQTIPTHSIVLSQGESEKTIENALTCWQEMHAQGVDRKAVVISLGGGVTSDLAGFVSGCYMRGIDLIHIPTTLLGMVDASIGGKTAVNIPTAKNLIGLFYQPKQIFFIPEFLNTLPEREFKSGLAEVIKYGVIADAHFFEFLEANVKNILNRDPATLNHLINRSCAIKSAIVEADFQEKDLRAILNWGHTFAHAIETATHYNTYLHGEAVAIGMCCAAALSTELHLAPPEFANRLTNLCVAFGLPTKLPKLQIKTLIELMQKDKKATKGKLTFIVASGLGKVKKLDSLDVKLVQKILEKQMLL